MQKKTTTICYDIKDTNKKQKGPLGEGGDGKKEIEIEHQKAHVPNPSTRRLVM